MADDGIQDILCCFEGCKNPAVRGGKCWGHIKRKQRKSGLTSELRARGTSPKERLMDAIFTVLEIQPTDDDGWRRAWDRLRMAATRYARAKKQGNRFTYKHSSERCPQKG